MTDTPADTGPTDARVDRWGELLRDFVRYTPDGESIPDEMWRGRHRKVVALLLAHVPALLVLGLYEGTESLVTGATIPATPLARISLSLGLLVALAFAAYWSRPSRRVRTALASVGLVSASATLVFFSGGYIEAHFHFFVVMAVVAVYEDWVPFVLGIGYVAVQHGYFGMINPSRVYNHAAAIDNPWAWAGIHAAFVLALAGALMANWYSTERSRETARDRLEEARDRTEQVESLEAKNEEIERARTEAEEAKAEAEARQREVERLNDRLERQADEYSAAMARAADGDLTVRLDESVESDAMARIADAFNDMLDETEATMRRIQGFADDVTDASREARTDAENAERAGAETSASMESIAEDAERQRELLEEASAEMNDLSATVEEVAASAETVAERSRETADVAATGETTARDAIDDARAAQAAIDSTVEHVETLEARMTEIVEIVDLIGDVAEQTNMLALNANIEAARAGTGTGTGGDGFAVVADEVKQLAEETRASASDVEALVEETRAQTRRTVEEVRTADDHIRDEVEAVEAVVDAFAEVAETAEDTDTGIQEVRTATDDQAESATETVSTIEDVAAISRTTAGEAETVAGTASDQADTVSQVSDTVESLADRAERLQQSLSKFDVGGDRHDGATDASGGNAALGDGGHPG